MGASAVAAYAVLSGRNEKESDLSRKVGEAVGPNRMFVEPQQVWREFIEVRVGAMIPYTQLFWPLFRNEQSLQQLTTLCLDALEQTGYADKQTRLRALPAIAMAHALGSLPSPEHRNFLNEQIYDVFRSALDLSQREYPRGLYRPDRDLLELLWRGMIAALIRNQGTWKTFEVSQCVLDQARDVIFLYLKGETALFAPAIHAWQFLWSYWAALRDRRAGVKLEELKRVIYQIEAVLEHSDDWWLRRLKTLLRPRSSFELILPNPAEVFMAYAEQHYNRHVKLFFLAFHLERVAINSLNLIGIPSRYVLKDRAIEVEKVAFRVVDAYGVELEDWHRLRRLALDGDVDLSEVTVGYWDSKFEKSRSGHEESDSRKSERLRAKSLSRWIEFRSFDEESISRRVWRSDEHAAKGFMEFGLAGLWSRAALSEGARFAQQQNINISERAILEQVGDFFENRAKEVSPVVQESFEEFRAGSRSTVGWTSGQVGLVVDAGPDAFHGIISNKNVSASNAGGATENAPSSGALVSSAATESTLFNDEGTKRPVRHGREVRIPPGTYTLKTLPLLSPGARKILEELEAEEEAEKRRLGILSGGPSDRLGDDMPPVSPLPTADDWVGPKLPNEGRVGLRLPSAGRVGLRLPPKRKG